MTVNLLRDRLIPLATWGLVLVLIYAGWTYATGPGGVSRILLASPDLVFAKLREILSTGAFIAPMRMTLYECAMAFSLAALFGLSIGYTIARSRFWVAVFEPLLSSLFTVPMVMFYPLCVLYFGIGPNSKIFFGFSVAFFPIVLAAISGFSTVDPTFVQSARSMGATRLQLFRYVLVPAAFPVVLSGLRMGAVLTFLSVLGSETLGSMHGLGHEIHNASAMMQTAHMYAYILIVLVLALLLNLGLGIVETFGNRRYGVTDGEQP